MSVEILIQQPFKIMNAKKFLSEVSDKARHMDGGLRHSFISLIVSGVNDDATLNESQQHLTEKRVNGAYNSSATEDTTKMAMEIATYINTCH